MKHYKGLWMLMLVLTSCHGLYSQTNTQPVYVIVHGAWGGGWSFKQVDALLTEAGSMVYRPTLTGQGERVHLAATNIGLDTHIADIVNTILYEDLYNVILVGHSYGGMVVTGVADSIPERIQQLIYLDAFLPEDGESALAIIGNRNEALFKSSDGFIIPLWESEDQQPPKDVPHPYKTLVDSITLNNPLRTKIATTYILTVAKGQDPKDDDFASQAERARKRGLRVVQLESDHNPQWSAPKALVAMLQEIVAE